MTQEDNDKEDHEDIPYQQNNVQGEMDDFFSLGNRLLDLYGTRLERHADNNSPTPAESSATWDREDLMQSYELLRSEGTEDDPFHLVQLNLTQNYPDGQKSIDAHVYILYKGKVQKATHKLLMTREQREEWDAAMAKAPEPTQPNQLKAIVKLDPTIEYQLNHLVDILRDAEAILSKGLTMNSSKE